MTLLSRKADYALLVLWFLHDRAAGGNARAIAERFGLSRPFVANILKELCQRGFLTSTRGVNGGYALRRPLGAVTLAELLDAVGEGFRLTVCSPHADGGDPAGPCDLEAGCPVRGPLAEIHQRIVGVLAGVTLAELFRPDGTARHLLPLTLRPAPEPAAALG